jgi:hypothetical protein
LRNLAETSDIEEFDHIEEVPVIETPFNFIKNEAPSTDSVHFPANEKNWISVLPESRKIDYPSFILKNNRELCYNNNSKDNCNINQHCNWVNSKICVCLLSNKIY